MSRPLVPCLTDAEPKPFWLSAPDRPAARRPLEHDVRADLAIVGGGYTGLWTAVLAKERHPDRDVVLLEARRVGWAASGRNGGFCSASLTHGAVNGASHFPGEAALLERLGRENLDEFERSLRRYAIACDFERTGLMSVATKPYQLAAMRNSPDYLGRDAVRSQVDSPTYLGGVWRRRDTALVDPARLAWGLAAAAEQLGVTIAEKTPAVGLERANGRLLRIRTASGATVQADRVALATNAFPSPLKRLRLYIVPVYDYVLVTQLLTSQQLGAIRWSERQGVEDVANQFHYYRLTPDNRILWGGYDAIYHFGRKIRAAYDQRPETFNKLARHFFATFPQLEGIRFTHRWGGAIDTCTRFFAFYGTAFGGRVSYALGYTGLGVAATRFGADVMLDLLSAQPTYRTELAMVRRKPVPFPPEPAAYAGIQLTRQALAAADNNQGRRNLWLRSLDRFGLGFDS
jgi:glycine/D-amino acid oxidase-like deaminating enzyme